MSITNFPLRVIIIDQHDCISTSTKHFLLANEVQILANTKDVDTALMLSVQLQPDLILFDELALNEENAGVISAFKQQPNPAVVVLVSSNGVEEDQQGLNPENIDGRVISRCIEIQLSSLIECFFPGRMTAMGSVVDLSSLGIFSLVYLSI